METITIKVERTEGGKRITQEHAFLGPDLDASIIPPEALLEYQMTRLRKAVRDAMAKAMKIPCLYQPKESSQHVWDAGTCSKCGLKRHKS